MREERDAERGLRMREEREAELSRRRWTREEMDEEEDVMRGRRRRERTVQWVECI